MLLVVSFTPIKTAAVRKTITYTLSIQYDSCVDPIVRFWGWSENAAEVAKDQEEMKQLIKEGKPLYGESSMPEHIQEMSARNSRFAQLKFSKSLV